MAPSRDIDDATSAATSVGEVSALEDRQEQDQMLTRVFQSCEKDPLGSVHRAWAASVLFMLLFFIFAIIEANKLREDVTSTVTLQVAAYYTAAIHLILMILGTFILKRFATAFTVGCFLGVTLVLSQQDLLMFAAFFNYGHGDGSANKIFANLALALFLCLGFFTLIMGHFKERIIVA
ncbi:hypothetical protein HJC23_009023 [Cyclotella cryptica]|uniref:Uncharacterized protein n=1 Tax=Cyclotella cryptica TaxID=29204 RepID=A0ABD3R2R2_9STRA|eukprot:CCRYP_000626-RA/>CCRYP_000626-RA protein AED:0.39 eAED:0.39 QI:293/1/1/1/1/1/2/1416/177